MGYADRTHTARPTCWGNENTYDRNDFECAECRFRHSCSAEVDKGARVPVNTAFRTNYRPQNQSNEGEAGVNRPAVIDEGERPVERFAKDALGGGLRGMFYEMWQFWKHYRIR
jgi:hypothetical protein